MVLFEHAVRLQRYLNLRQGRLSFYQGWSNYIMSPLAAHLQPWHLPMHRPVETMPRHAPQRDQ